MRKTLAPLFGGTCYLCRGNASGLLCAPCEADLPRLAQALCPRCALPSPQAAVCGRCLGRTPSFDATHAALAYEFAADALVLALKHGGELAIAGLLADLLLERIGAERVDCVIPVPLSAARLRERGYNQAAEIARPLSVRLRAPLELSLCERSRDTPPQTGDRQERHANVRGAFRCTRSLAGAAVAVVDDVMTTGATLEELAATLKAAGAARVVNWVAARTLPAD